MYEQDGEISSMDDLMKIVNAEFDDGAETPENDPAPENDTIGEDPKDAPDNDGDVEPKDYVPDFTYSVKGEEKEFDARLQSAIKTKEDEEYVREMITKAEGLDSYKEKLTSAEQLAEERAARYEEVNGKLETNQAFYEGIVKNRDAGDWRSVNKSIGIDDEAVLKMALEIAAERELSPAEQAQRQQYRSVSEESKTNAAKLAEQEARLAEYEQRMQENEQIERTNEVIRTQTESLNTMLDSSHGDLKTKMETLGLNMFDEVVAVGNMMTKHNNGVEPTLEAAVLATVQKYAKLAEQQAPTSTTRTRKDSLPSIRGNNSNVVESSVNNIDDLKKALEALEKQKL